MTTRASELNPLFTSATALKGVGEAVGKSLAKLLPAGPNGVPVLRDLVFHVPSGLIDRTKTYPLTHVPSGETGTFTVTVEAHKIPPRNRGVPYRILCSNDTGTLSLVFFHAKGDWLQRKLPVGHTRVVSGICEYYGGKVQMTHPEMIATEDEWKRMPKVEAIYPLTAGISNKKLSGLIEQALRKMPGLPEWLSKDSLKIFKLPPWHEALIALHQPQTAEDLQASAQPRMRMAYDEILANQLYLAIVRKQTADVPATPIKPTNVLRKQLADALPFKLTGSQREAVKDIDADMASGKRMIRMIQGDVGSGKTLVALVAALSAVENGFQVALMAPTELIARQHAATLAGFCEKVCHPREGGDPEQTAELDSRFRGNDKVRVVCLTGSVKGKQRQELIEQIASGEVDIIVGTHALFQESVSFHKLGLVIIDEQHRFGVQQRMALTDKGDNPHLLHMSATPIPRTLTMTCYGDMDCSLMTDKPPGRTPIKTSVVPNSRLDDIYGSMKAALKRGEKIYWICPQIEDEKLSFTEDVAAAEARYLLFKVMFGEDKAGLVHGRIAADERDKTMQKFASGDIRLLVATTVVEVGVDVKDATIMIIEAAEKFGLAQLHQLRGRVGRGEKASSCLLIYSEKASEVARSRLSILRETEDGFRIAEEDLKIRGGGDLLGRRQSGLPKFRFTDLTAHRPLISHARDDAKAIIENNEMVAGERTKALHILLNLYGYDYGY